MLEQIENNAQGGFAMPEGYISARPYPGRVFRLRDAAAANQLIVVRCLTGSPVSTGEFVQNGQVLRLRARSAVVW
jgi:hypothetical protein